MKKLFVILSLFLMLFICSNSEAWDSGSTGVDGAFDLSVTPQVVPSYVTVNSTAKTATVALPIDGVMNLTYMNVLSGWTVKFIKNSNNTPVYLRAKDTSTTSIIINGTIDASGESVGCAATPGAGGPGGYDGGYGGPIDEPGGNGLGPGGGDGAPDYDFWRAGGGGYGTAGGTAHAEGGPSYGNANIVPVIGGSGGGGGFGRDNHTGYAGAGGGGAIVMASSGTITINGSIKANGGAITCSDHGGNGSGGAIKLMTNYLNGSGTLSANGANLTWQNKGGQGRIRIEVAISNTFGGSASPSASFDNTPGSVLPASAPTLTITSIAGQTPPSRTGSYSSPDIVLPSGSSNLVTVNISAQNIPTTSIVTVKVIPQYGSVDEYRTTLTGNQSSSQGYATVTLSTEYPNVVVAETAFIMTASMYYDNEKIEKVRVAAAMGKGSEAVYITQSGKEIAAKELKLAGLIR